MREARGGFKDIEVTTKATTEVEMWVGGGEIVKGFGGNVVEVNSERSGRAEGRTEVKIVSIGHGYALALRTDSTEKQMDYGESGNVGAAWIGGSAPHHAEMGARACGATSSL